MAAPSVLASPADPSGSFWCEAGGWDVLGGRSLIGSCEPHFHETYVIGYIRSGGARTRVGSQLVDLRPGSLVLAHPYEVISCVASSGFDYDVCYPSQQVMAELATGGASPRFLKPTLRGPEAEAFGALLSQFCSAEGAEPSSLAALQEGILRLVLSQRQGVFAERKPEDRSYISEACAMIDELLEEPLPVDELSRRVGRSRSQFAHAFRTATGLPPSAYIRQLRLARGLERIRRGEALAEVAASCGFADQAHFTRQFKRVYGTTPGKFARDIHRCRLCAGRSGLPGPSAAPWRAS